MKRRLAFIVALAAVPVVVAAAGPGGTRAGGARASEQPFYALLAPSGDWRNRTQQLVRLDPQALAPVGRRLTLAQPRFLDRSPDGRFAAFGREPGTELRVVDLAAMHVFRRIRLGIGPAWRVREVAWPTADRLVVLVQRNRGAYRQIVDLRKILVVDPLAGRVIATRRFDEAAALRVAERAGDKLVLLFGRADARSGLLRLAVIGSDGGARLVRLRMGPIQGRFLPALVLEPSGQRAFVIAAGAPVAEVDLASLTVAEHTVRGGGDLFAAAPFAGRRAVWVGDGKIAVAGENIVGRGESTRPLGVAILDTTTWQLRTLDRTSSAVTATDDVILGHGFRVERAGRGGRLVGLGVRAYDLEGRRLGSASPGRACTRSRSATAQWSRSRRLIHSGTARAVASGFSPSQRGGRSACGRHVASTSSLSRPRLAARSQSAQPTTRRSG